AVLEPRPVARAGAMEQPAQPVRERVLQLLDRAIALERALVLRDAEQRVRPRSRAREGRQRGEGRVEELAAEIVAARIMGPTDHRAQGPERAAVAVLGADRLGPPARVRHEVAEAAVLGVEGGRN